MQIPYLNQLTHVSAQESVAVLQVHGLRLSIDYINWPDVYTFCPVTNVYLAHTGTHLYVLYDVRGEQPRATVSEDGCQVCEDSCVEFFCQGLGDNHYINLEANCIGKMKASRRLGRKEDVTPLHSNTLARIERFASLGNEPFGEKEVEQDWQLCLKIPMDIIFEDRTPQAIRANFYKCADKSRKPHYVVWQPIKIDKPDFHRPEFFKELILETQH